MDIQYFASALQHNESLSLAFFGRQVVTADRAPPPPPPTYGTSMGNIPGSSAYTSPGIGPSPVSAPTGPPPPPLIKDIETITLYRKDGATSESEKVVATQRTATFLSPSNNGDPYLAAAVQRVGGRAVDVRTYRVSYTRIRDANRGQTLGDGSQQR